MPDDRQLQRVAQDLEVIRLQVQSLAGQIPEHIAARVAQIEVRLARAEADLLAYATRMETREARFVPLERYVPVERALFWLVGTISALVIAYWVTLLLKGGRLP